MSTGNAEIVRSMYASFAVGDVPGVLGKFDPNIVWNEAENFPYADKNPYIGPAAVLEGLFMRLATEWDGWKVEVGELLDAGDTVVALGRYKATRKGTGAKLDAQFVHVWKFSGGKAVKFQQYADTAQAQKVYGGK